MIKLHADARLSNADWPKRTPDRLSDLMRGSAVAEHESHDQKDHGNWATGGAATESKEFKAWWDDSKVVDDNGEPLMVFHGTNAELDKDFAFDPDKIGSATDAGFFGQGFYFVGYKDPEWTPRAEGEARYYGKNVGAFWLSLQNPLDLTSPRGVDSTQDRFLHWYPKFQEMGLGSEKLDKQFSFYTDIKSHVAQHAKTKEDEGGGFKAWVEHPELPAQGRRGHNAAYTGSHHGVHDTPKAALDYLSVLLARNVSRAREDYDLGQGQLTTLSDYVRTSLYADELTVAAKAKGHDGVRYGDEYVVFDPANIKAVKNRGSFDKNSEKVFEHTPGGQAHDQDKHGNRAGGAGSDSMVAAIKAGLEDAGDSLDDYESIDEYLNDITSEPELFAKLDAEEQEALASAKAKTGAWVGDDAVIIAGVELDRDEFDEGGDLLYGLAKKQESRGIGLDGEPMSAGQITLDGGHYEPEDEPDLDEFMRNHYPAQDYIHGGTGFVLADGYGLDMSHGQGMRVDDHRQVIPTSDAMNRWGWSKDAIKNRTTAMWATMAKARAARVNISGDSISVNLTHNPTSSQVRAISSYINDSDISSIYLDIQNGSSGPQISTEVSSAWEMGDAISDAFEKLTSGEVQESESKAKLRFAEPVAEHEQHNQKDHGNRGGKALTLDDAEGSDQIRRVLKERGAERTAFFWHESADDSEFWVAENGDIIKWDGKSKYADEFDRNGIWQIDISDGVAKFEDEFNKQFWNRPGPLFHATEKDHVAGILKDGLLAMDETRGMSNRRVGAAVFASTETEEISHYYGPSLFEVDTEAMKRDGFTPYVSQEPDIPEGDVRGAVASALFIEDFDPEYESGMSHNTVIIHDDIPAKYIKEL